MQISRYDSHSHLFYFEKKKRHCKKRLSRLGVAMAVIAAKDPHAGRSYAVKRVENSQRQAVYYVIMFM